MFGRSGPNGSPGRCNREELLLAARELGDQTECCAIDFDGRYDAARPRDRSASGRFQHDAFRARPLLERVRVHRGRHKVPGGNRGLEHQPTRGLDMRRKLADSTRKLPSLGHPRFVEMAPYEQLRSTNETCLESIALEIRPLFESRAARDPERWQKRAVITVDGGIEITALERREKPIAVDLDWPHQAELFGAQHRIITKLTPKLEQRLTKGIARAIRVHIRPQQVDQRFA